MISARNTYIRVKRLIEKVVIIQKSLRLSNMYRKTKQMIQ